MSGNTPDFLIRIDGDPGTFEAATRKVEAGARKMTADVQRVGQASRATARDLALVNMQITDIGVSLASGQSPFLVLLQQGGQLRDQFGSVGGAIRGVGSALAAMVSPAGLAAVGAGAVALAFFQGDKQSREFRDTLIVTGNAAGQTADSFELAARSVADATDTTISSARDAVLAAVKSGAFGPALIEPVSEVAARIADLTGRSADEVVKEFGAMRKGVADFAAEANERYNFLTVQQYRYIKSLEDAGNAQGAQEEVVRLLNEQLEGAGRNLGTLEGLWRDLGNAASTAWDQMLAIGRDLTPLERLQKAREAQGRQARMAGGGYLSQWLFGSAEEAQMGVDTANRDLLRGVEGASTTAMLAEEQRKAIAKQREADAKAEQERRRLEAEARARANRTSTLRFNDPTVARTPPVEINLSSDRLRASITQDEQRAAARAREGLQALLEEQRQVNVDLITDDKARAEAQLAIELDTLRARADQLRLYPEMYDQAMAAVNEISAARAAELVEQFKPEWKKLLEEWKATTNDMQKAFDDFATEIVEGGEDAFTEWARTGKFSARSLADSIIAELARIAYRKSIAPLLGDGINWLQTGLNAFFGGGGGGNSIIPGGAPLPDVLRGGAANGGSLMRGQLLPVNELGTELLTQGGKDYLMVGAGGGRVTPAGTASALMDQARAGRGQGGGVQQTVHYHVAAGVSMVELQALFAANNRALAEASARDIRRPGRALYNGSRRD